LIPRRKHLLAAVLAVGALTLTACSGPGPSGTDTDTGADIPQEIAVAGGWAISVLDPYGQYSRDQGLSFVANNIYDTLFVAESDGSYSPHLSTSWATDDDGKTWTFKLRDAKFSDGTDFTSADVKASVEAIESGGGPLAPLWKGVTVDTPDEHTVVLTPPTPGLAILGAIPELRIGPADQISEQGFFNKPVGLGPYMVKSYTPSQEVVLVRNPNYWGEPATLDQVTIKTIPDISARVTALLNGEVQAIWDIPDDQFKSLQDNPALNTKVQTSYSQLTMWMNASVPALSDLRVRKAIWKAIDWKAIQESLYPFSATLAKAPVSQAANGAGSFDPYTYDPDAAKQLLAEAGHPDGLTVRVQYSTRNDFAALTAAIKSYLAKVGITLDVQPMEQPVYAEKLLALDFEITAQPIGLATGDPTSNLSRLYASSANRTGFRSDELDQLIATGNAATDQAERTADFVKVQKFIWDNAIGMFPLDLAGTYAWSKTLVGFTPSPSYTPDLSQVKVVSTK